MAYGIGLKIGVEGEKEYKKALSEINESFKVLGSEMTLIDSQFDKNEKTVESLTEKNKVLDKEIDTQKQKIETLTAALNNASESFGENDKRTQEWQIKLNKAQASLNDMERELTGNEKALADMANGSEDAGKESEKLGKSLKNAADDVQDSGGKFEKLGGILKGIGAAAGAAFAVIGTASISAGKALSDLTVSTAAYADEMITNSTVTGVSVEKLQAYSYAADLVDVSLNTLTSSMAKNVKSMSNAANGSAKYAEAYEKLGVSVTNADGTLRDSEQVYWDIIDALGTVSSETERDTIAMQIFGKSAQELNPLIAQGSTGIAKLTDEAKKAGAVLSDDTVKQFGKFDDSVQRLKQGSEAAKRSLGTILLPQLQLLADDGVKLIGEFTRGLNDAGGDYEKIGDVIGNTVGKFGEMILRQLPQIIDVGLEIIMSLGTALTDNIDIISECAVEIINTLASGFSEAVPQLTEGAVTIIMSLADSIITNLPLLASAAITMISSLAQGITQALPELIPSIVNMLTTVVQIIADNLPILFSAGLELIQGIADGLLKSLPVLIKALPQIIKSLVDFFIGAIPEIIEAGVELLTSLTENLPEIINGIVEVLPELVQGIIGGLVDNTPAMVEAGITLFTALITDLPQIIMGIVSALPQITEGIITGITEELPKMAETGLQLFLSIISDLPQILIEMTKAAGQIVTSITDCFSNAGQSFINIGQNIVSGLWEGIKNSMTWLKDNISNWASNIVGGIKDALGIHSPSKVMEDEVGENLAKGVEVGYDKGMKKAAVESRKTTREYSDSLIKDVSAGQAEITRASSETVQQTADQLMDKQKKVTDSAFMQLNESQFDNVKSFGVRITDLISSFADSMRGVGGDIQAAVPSDFSLNTNISGLMPATPATFDSGSKSCDVTIPLMIEGRTLSRVLAEIEWSDNAVYVRNIGYGGADA